ncbi:MAG: SpoIID/LytB domain-containing protein [Deltaproteobacteria bacterium]|nr:SpoIID/LytB domain-containing protein [Deltaproteobacteria bacterium]
MRGLGLFMLLLLSLAPVAAAGESPAPLRVRILSRYHPRQVLLTAASSARCDGQPVPQMPVKVEAAEPGTLRVGKLACRELLLEGAILRLGEVERGYRGRVRAREVAGEIRFVNEVDIEGYLLGVLAGELPAGAPEAMKAQAVVSRTFAVTSRGRHQPGGLDLCDLAHCQVYRGRSGEGPEAARAVQATRGVVLKVDGQTAQAWFHSSCGGATSSPWDVFGERSALRAVSDRGDDGKALCSAAPEAGWTWTVSRSALAQGLGLAERGAAVEVSRKDRGGRALEVRIFGSKMSGAELLSRVGRAFGWMKLKSLNVTVEESDGQVRFKGHGLGHGVGLCQWGARELDRRGADWRRILEHYFPKAEVGQLDADL